MNGLTMYIYVFKRPSSCTAVIRDKNCEDSGTEGTNYFLSCMISTLILLYSMNDLFDKKSVIYFISLSNIKGIGFMYLASINLYHI